MAWAAVAGAAISVVGGAMASKSSSGAASGAADKSAEASQYATDVQKQMYDQTRADQTPWREGGQSALYKLLNGMGISTPVGGYSSTPKETRAQIMDRLTPQYTSNASGNGANGLMNVYGRAVNNVLPSAQQAFLHRNDAPMWASNGSEDNSGQQVEGNLTQQGQNSSIDTNALNAAVDAEWAKQNNPAMSPAGDGFGDLAHKFTMADYQADPGYAFRVAEGQRALDNSAAARGGLQSGNALKAAARYGQDMGSQEYGNAYNRFNNDQTNQFNRLSSIAGVGQTANNSLASAGANFANQTGNYAMTNGANQGNALLSAGNARASGYSGLGKALGGVNWGGLGGSSGSSPGYSWGGTNGAEDFTNGWNSSNYG